MGVPSRERYALSYLEWDVKEVCKNLNAERVSKEGEVNQGKGGCVQKSETK